MSPNPNKTLTLTLVGNDYGNEFVIDNVIGYSYIANHKTRGAQNARDNLFAHFNVQVLFYFILLGSVFASMLVCLLFAIMFFFCRCMRVLYRTY